MRKSRNDIQATADATSAHAAFRPPRRVTVSQGAQDALYLRQPGGYVGPWSPDETPYMVEPMDMMASKRHEAVVFVGPARTGKTMGLLDGFLAYAITCDPGDSLVVQMTQEKAREFSKTRIDRAIKHSAQINALMSKTGHDDNTHDKLFRHGMWLKIGWPTVTQLSGSDYRYVMLTDYDRMPDDIDGEGSAFGLALKRTQTFLSRGMCLVESSPGRPITDPNWQQTTQHEGPPCTGVVGVYNRSDRRRWYWPCPDCGEWFEAKPGLDLFCLPDEQELIETVREADLDEIARKYARVVCPHCGSLIDKKHKHAMNRAGRWLADGQAIVDGVVVGEPIRSSIAGYWLGGVAAAYQSWHSLILRYLQGLREYVLTGSELTLQNTVNTDQGLPYLSRLVASNMRKGTGPESRRDDTLERFIVPDEARFVLAAVDVQGGQAARFVVQVHAIGPNLEMWPIDRYAIVETSKREGVDGGNAPLDPATYPEDWDMITEMVVKATYRTTQDGREVKMKAVAVDSGGEDGVTDKAYEWYRRLRRDNLHGSVMLIKGSSTPGAPLIKESWVGSKRGSNASDKGDIPLYLINTNLFKDAISAALKRPVPGPTYYHIPSWLPKSFFDELNAEVRDEKGRWNKVRKRNEALDLSCYIRALCVRLGADRPIFWDTPPTWANPLDGNNPMVITREERQRLQSGDTGGVRAAAFRRRSSKSSYLK